MAAEIAKRDADRNPVNLGVTNDASLEVRMFRVDPSTNRLLVDAGSITTSSASAGLTGSAVPTSGDYIAGNKSGNLTGLLIGSQTSANSLAVVIASDQATVPISIAAAQTLATVTTLTSITNNVKAIGGTAAGSAVANAPITTGGQAKTANPTAVADGQAVNATYDKLGKQVVVGSIRDLKANQITTISASVSETTIVTAVASTFLDLYGLIITNTSASAVNVAIKDGTAGTTRLNIAVPAGDTRGFMLPEGAAIKQSTVNSNWTATSSGSISSLIITALTVQNL